MAYPIWWIKCIKIQIFLTKCFYCELVMKFDVSDSHHEKVNDNGIVHCVTRGRSVCFYGEGNVFRTRRSRARRRRARPRRVLKTLLEPKKWSPPSHTRYFFWHPLGFRYFSYPWVGSAIMFFEAAERRENTDLQAVALIYTYCESN